MRVYEITLLGLLGSASPLASQAPAGVDTTPVGVVQRFVDGANARDLALMMSAVAPDAVFAPLPDGAPLAVGRDSVQAFACVALGRVAGAGFTGITAAIRLDCDTSWSMGSEAAVVPRLPLFRD